MFKHQTELEQLQLEELRKKIRSSIKQTDDGKGIPIEEVSKHMASRRAKKV